MIRQLIACAAGVAAMTGVSQASVVDLSGFGHGEKLVDQIAGLAVTATSNGGGQSNDFAIVFNTGTPGSGSGGDSDLGATFDDPSTPGNEMYDPGNILVVAEGGCSGDFCRPDDNASGGSITFAFDEDKIFNSMDVFDMRTNALTVTLFDAGGAIAAMVAGPDFNTDTNGNGQNEFTTLDFGGVRFRSALFEFRDSGGIGAFDITQVPVPGAALLFLTALAGARLRRR
ncbi:MAG: hypothetical protein AAFX08_02670 [Pseudomonadota bacterium]